LGCTFPGIRENNPKNRKKEIRSRDEIRVWVESNNIKEISGSQKNCHPLARAANRITRSENKMVCNDTGQDNLKHEEEKSLMLPNKTMRNSFVVRSDDSRATGKIEGSLAVDL